MPTYWPLMTDTETNVTSDTIMPIIFMTGNVSALVSLVPSNLSVLVIRGHIVLTCPV